MRGTLAVLLVLLAGGRLSGAAADDGKTPEGAARVTRWLAAKPEAQALLTEQLRSAGASLAPALRAARAKAQPAARKRIDGLLRAIRVDFERAKTPEGMVYIPAGLLEVPQAKSPWGPSGARRPVGAFYLDRTEVTVARWRAWLLKLEAREEGLPGRLGLRQPSAEVDGRLPISRVRNVDAVRFAKAHGARLPTADEFERALRGSGVSTYPWGASMRGGCANLRDHGPGRPVPVGSHPRGASPFGVQDLVGNVAEWSATTVAQGTRGRYALLLGGSYADRPDPALTWRGRSRMRARVGPRERQPWVGFRLARTPPALPR